MQKILIVLVVMIGQAAFAARKCSQSHVPVTDRSLIAAFSHLAKPAERDLDIDALKEALKPNSPLDDRLIAQIRVLQNLQEGAINHQLVRLYLENWHEFSSSQGQYSDWKIVDHENPQRWIQFSSVMQDFFSWRNHARSLVMSRLMRLAAFPVVNSTHAYFALAELAFLPSDFYVANSRMNGLPADLIEVSEHLHKADQHLLNLMRMEAFQTQDYAAQILKIARVSRPDQKRAWHSALQWVIDHNANVERVQEFAKELGIHEPFSVEEKDDSKTFF